MLPLVADELDRAKLVPYAHLVKRLRELHQGRLWICSLEKPEPCPRGATGLAAGCSDSMAGTTLWVAKPSMEAALAHELGHVLSIRGGYYAAGHGHPPEVFGPGGVVAKALARYMAGK
jgi:formyltetrahydrofolate synthetase